jgi:hypothetical protein
VRNFLRGVGVGVIVAYIFHDDLDEALRKGLTKANQIVDGPSKPVQPVPQGARPTAATGGEAA